MKDKRIKVADNSMVFFDDNILGIDGENLQGKIIFYFNNFKDGVAWLEFEKGDRTKGYIPLNKVNETYELEIKSSLLSDTKRIWMQLRITQDENIKGIPVFKSNKFFMDVLDSINATSTIQEEYPNILDVVNEKQDKLVAGANITIDGNVISATGGGGVSDINDVQVDGVSVVENKIANIQLRQAVIDILVKYGLIKLENLTQEQIEALNNMTCEIDENGELSVTYDETVLNINLQVEDGNLIIDNNINATFNINENGELEVSYE